MYKVGPELHDYSEQVEIQGGDVCTAVRAESGAWPSLSRFQSVHFNLHMMLPSEFV